MIKVVCFDLDGVFFKRVHEGIIDILVRKFQLEKSFVENVMFVRSANEGGYNNLKLGIGYEDTYWDWFFTTLGIADRYTLKDYLADLHNCYQINQEAAELISGLHSRGIKTAICSNNYRANILGLKEKFELDKYFDVQVYSYEIGVMKPEVKIYEELIKQANVKAEEIALSDDSPNKLAGAVSLGIKAFVYENFAQFIAELKNLGVEI